MTSTVANKDYQVMGGSVVKTVTLTISSYATGGEDVSPSKLGLSGIRNLVAVSKSYGAFPVWDETNGKLKLMSAAATEVTATTNCGDWIVRVEGY